MCRTRKELVLTQGLRTGPHLKLNVHFWKIRGTKCPTPGPENCPSPGLATRDTDSLLLFFNDKGAALGLKRTVVNLFGMSRRSTHDCKALHLYQSTNARTTITPRFSPNPVARFQYGRFQIDCAQEANYGRKYQFQPPREVPSVELQHFMIH